MNSDFTRPAPPEADLTRTQGELPTRTGELPKDESSVVPHASTAAGAVDAPPGFAIEREIGVGGMGVVYLARQLGLNRPVALKLVKDARVDAKALIRFLAEAEVVASIRHPNVVEVYSYGDHEGRPFLALEYCPGGDLTTLSKADHTRDAGWFRRVADLMAKVADGVNAAHAQGIVHRDLKPHNVFLTADGTPKVADFGLAKRGIGSDLTNTQAVLGTPAYMSPEQAGGGTKFVGPEADVWALGVMLYELACGERPIDTSGPLMAAVAKVANATVPPLRSKCSDVPSDFALIVHKCLATEPRDRYPTAGGLAADLRNWLDGKPISARPIGGIEQAVKWAKRNPKVAATAAGVVLVLVGLVVALVWANGERESRLAGERNNLRDSRQAAARLALARGNPRTLLAVTDEMTAAGVEVDSELRLERARAHQTLGDQSGVERELDALAGVSLSPAERAAVAMLRAERHVLSEFDRADEFFHEAERWGVTPADAAYIRGLRAGRTTYALAEFKTAIELEPRHLPARQLAALTAFLLGERTLAESILQQSRLLAPEHPAFALLAGSVGTALDRPGADQLLAGADARLGPSSLSLIMVIGQTFRELNAIRMAEARGEKVPLPTQLLADLQQRLKGVDGAVLAVYTEKQSPPFLRAAWKVIFTHQFRLDLNQILQVIANPVPRKWDRARLAAFRRELDNHPEGTAYFMYGLGLHSWASGKDRHDAAPDRAEQARAFREAGDILKVGADRPMSFDVRADSLDLAATAYWHAAVSTDDKDEQEKLYKQGAACTAERYRRYGLPVKERLLMVHNIARRGGDYTLATACIDALERVEPANSFIPVRRAQLAEKTGNPTVARREAEAVLRAKEGTYTPEFRAEADRILSWANAVLRKLELYETLPPPRKDE